MYSQALRDRINDSEKKNAFIELTSETWANMKNRCGENEFSQWELHCAFDVVADKEHWKNPVDAIIPDADIDITLHAIIRMTASSPRITSLGNGTSRIEAVGYFQAVGA